MKRLIWIIGAAFGVAMATIIGTRMSSDAMAIVVGIVCGVAASVPTSLLVAYILRQRDGAQRESGHLVSYRSGGTSPYPPVVVVTPGPNGSQAYAPPLPALPLPGNGSGGRSFKVIGQEGTEAMDDTTHLSALWDEVP